MPPAERSEPYPMPAGAVSAAPKKGRKKKGDASLAFVHMFSAAFHLIPAGLPHFGYFPLIKCTCL